MYHCSTQRDNWTFNGKEDLERIREKTNQTYRSKKRRRFLEPNPLLDKIWDQNHFLERRA